MAFTAPLFRKFTSAHRNYTEISYRNFTETGQQIWLMRTEIHCAHKKSEKYDCFLTDCYETNACSKFCNKIRVPNLNKNATNGVVAETRSKTDGRTWSSHKVFLFYLVKNTNGRTWMLQYTWPPPTSIFFSLYSSNFGR